MGTGGWILLIALSNLVTFFVAWRGTSFYMSRMPEILAQTNGMRLWDYLQEDDIAWIREQLGKDPDFLRKFRTTSATTRGQDQ